jgi:hypothetical protein
MDFAFYFIFISFDFIFFFFYLFFPLIYLFICFFVGRGGVGLGVLN